MLNQNSSCFLLVAFSLMLKQTFVLILESQVSYPQFFSKPLYGFLFVGYFFVVNLQGYLVKEAFGIAPQFSLHQGRFTNSMFVLYDITSFYLFHMFQTVQYYCYIYDIIIQDIKQVYTNNNILGIPLI